MGFKMFKFKQKPSVSSKCEYPVFLAMADWFKMADIIWPISCYWPFVWATWYAILPIFVGAFGFDLEPSDLDEIKNNS